MRRRINGFVRDEHGDWIARLDCHHSQHIRHQPPFRDAPWIHDDDAHAERVATLLDCPLCDRAQLPAELTVAHTTVVWDEDTMPERLGRSHRIAPGTWGLLHVVSGQAQFAADTDPPLVRIVDAGDAQPIPPSTDHSVQPIGQARFYLEFLRPAGSSDIAEPTG